MNGQERFLAVSQYDPTSAKNPWAEADTFNHREPTSSHKLTIVVTRKVTASRFELNGNGDYLICL